MRKKSLFLLTFSFFQRVSTSFDVFTCTWTDPSNNLEYDFSSLIKKSDEKSYTHNISFGGIDTEFAWNICERVSSSTLPKLCNQKEGKNRYHMAYMFTADDCWVIGKYDASNTDVVALLDDLEPSLGVSVTYGNGTWCGNSTEDVVIELYCSDHEVEVVDVKQRGPCSFHITMKTIFACQRACPYNENGICGGVGQCRFDTFNNNTFCSCDDDSKDEIASNCSTMTFTDDRVERNTSWIASIADAFEDALSFDPKWKLTTEVMITIAISCFIITVVVMAWKLDRQIKRQKMGYLSLPTDENSDVAEVNSSFLISPPAASYSRGRLLVSRVDPHN